MKSRATAQELVQRARQADTTDEGDRLMREAFFVDPSNTDALVWRAQRVAIETAEGIAMLEDAVEIAVRRLEPETIVC